MSFTRPELLLLLATTLCLPACGETTDDTVGGTESGTQGTVGTVGTSDTKADTDTEATAPGSDSDDTTDGIVDPMVPAGGIDIVAVEANQGTRVDIGLAGEWAGGEDRSTYLLDNRNTLVRVHFTVASDWVPHEVEARLRVTYPDQTEKLLTQVLMVEKNSQENDLGSTFSFGLAASEGEVIPNMSYKVELYEHEDVHTTEPGIWATPADDSQLVGIEDDPMEMKVVLVPIHYTAEGKNITANPSEEALTRLRNWMLDTNPVQSVIFEMHEPLEWNQPIPGLLFDVLNAVAQLRAADAPGENVYYHALLDLDCAFVGCGGGGLLGQAIDLPSDSKSDAYVRVAASVYHDPGGVPTDLTLETIVHEHGHSQGLQHIFCPGGGSQGNDPNYPHSEGEIEGWGFGISNSLLYPPDFVDYMSYCHPQFVGPWTWTKVYARVMTLTSWDYEDREPAPMGELLIAAHNPETDAETWWTVKGGLSAARTSATHTIEVWRDGEVTTQPAEVRTMSDGPGYWVVTDMPDLEGVEKLVHVGPEVRYEIAPSAISQTFASK